MIGAVTGGGAGQDVDRLGRVTLALLTEPGDPRIARLVAASDARAVVARIRAEQQVGGLSNAEPDRLAEIDPVAVLDRAADQGIRYVTPADREWPRQLGGLGRCDPLHGLGGVPLGLWVRGDLDLGRACEDAVAVVGARAATSYGQERAAELSSRLAEAGKTILSGAAFGIDQAAHRGALSVTGATIAVLACGADRAYPTAHTALLHDIARTGVIVSECPPGTVPTRSRFLARNRVLAGLAEATVVVEAAIRSGAANTANWSTRIGRPVFAVPGPVTSATSQTPHQLIRAGVASLVNGAEDVLADLAQHQAAASATAIDETYRPQHTRGREHHPVPGGSQADRRAPTWR